MSSHDDENEGLNLQTLFVIGILLPVLGGMFSGPFLGISLMCLAMFDSLYILAGFN
jgi:hypothetical protein